MDPSISERRPSADIETSRVEKPQHTDRLSLQGDELKAEIAPYREDAFGDEAQAEVKYKVLKWWQCGILMVAETVSLGVLALPAAVAGLGLAPALIILVALGLIASYTGYIIGQFKLRFPHISSMADAGEILFGPVGRELFGVGQMLFLIFLMASHILTFTTALNTISGRATCSIVFGVVGLVVSFLLSVPRTMKKMSWLSIASFISIVAAVLVTMVAVGVQNRPQAITATVDTDVVNGGMSAANIALSYASHNAFFNFIAELKEPRDFPKALTMLQCTDISIYIVAIVVIYYYTGQSVESPALGSAGPLISKIAYGVALPTIVIAGVINGHIAAKSIYIRIFAGTNRMQKRDFVAVGSWIAITLALWIIAWVIASAIPVFNNLLSLMTALFASWFSFGFPGFFWLFMNRGLWFSSPKKVFLTGLNVFIVCMGATLCGVGLYASGKAIHDSSSGASFSCSSSE